MKTENTITFKSGKITILPHKKGMAIFRNKKEILKLSIADGQSLMLCFLDFANKIIPKQDATTETSDSN